MTTDPVEDSVAMTRLQIVDPALSQLRAEVEVDPLGEMLKYPGAVVFVAVRFNETASAPLGTPPFPLT